MSTYLEKIEKTIENTNIYLDSMDIIIAINKAMKKNIEYRIYLESKPHLLFNWLYKIIYYIYPNILNSKSFKEEKQTIIQKIDEQHKLLTESYIVATQTIIDKLKVSYSSIIPEDNKLYQKFIEYSKHYNVTKFKSNDALLFLKNDKIEVFTNNNKKLIDFISELSDYAHDERKRLLCLNSMKKLE